jgi:hypothetical protein
MSDHSGLLGRYRRIREVKVRLNNLLLKTIPKKTLEECGRLLGFYRKGVMVFETEDETALLMDYCLYYPGPDGRNLVAKYLEESPPPAGSDELAALRAMTHAYYSIFQATDVERGVGVSVQDLLRGETGFVVDVGFGETAQRHMILATRIIPMEGFLMTGGAALPLDASAAKRFFDELARTNQTPDTLDFHSITPRQEAAIAALIIRTGRSAGMSSHIVYAEPGSPARPLTQDTEGRRSRRDAPCPCGSGKKYRACCGRR